MEKARSDVKIISQVHSHIKKRDPIDWFFFMLIVVMVAYGLVMVFSASYAYAYYRESSSLFYIQRQLPVAVVGIVAMYIISLFDYHILLKFAFPLLLVSSILLLVALVFDPVNGARRWIYIGSNSFQPSEIAKFAIILFFSMKISQNYDRMRQFKYGVLPFLSAVTIIVVPLGLERHLSGAILVGLIALGMLFIGGLNPAYYIGGGAVLGVTATLYVLNNEYAQKRIQYWLDPLSDPSGNAYQTLQSLYAIGSGGLFGLGLGNSRQKHLYVPEPANDFIFAILCEELGFIGAMSVILLFIILMIRGFYIAFKAKDKFGFMLVAGIIIQITLQAALNIAVVTNTIPNTGISLPFFSYGGTSLLMLLCEIGVILSVSRQSAIHKT